MPDWAFSIANKQFENPPNNLINFKKSWDEYMYHNFSLELPLITIPQQLYKFRLDDNSIHNYNELNNINYLTRKINNKIANIYADIDYEIKFQNMSDKYKSCDYDVNTYLRRYSFSSIFLENYEQKCIMTLINIIHQIDGAEKWLLNNYKNLYETNDEIMIKI